MANILERNRRDLDRSPGARRWASPAILTLETALARVISQEARGDLLDAGCGSMPYRSMAAPQVRSYDGLDIEARAPGVQYVCSITDMSPVASGAYDTVLCSEVLEHVAEPLEAMIEMSRVLRPGGRLILTVPFLGRLHEEPHDYYRYTLHGLRSLAERSQLRPESIDPIGSVASFLGHQIASVIVASTWHIPVLKWIALGATAAIITLPCTLLDRIAAPLRRKLPLGYVMVASKP